MTSANRLPDESTATPGGHGRRAASRHGSRAAAARTPGPERDGGRDDAGGVVPVLVRVAELSACCAASFLVSLLAVAALATVAVIVYTLVK
ncbi:hypothetical protein [Actinacidiphila acidipaludis]|uniref:Uncharacterized protein n=1 Tax=Actinacidiphila acidipaludis TaxID=2873382 RepID=A0ABS7Q538_9ACTN|nr:hypothetical protein [Streptomyces acidipaludis]MBY8878271.1 hypothetical protein [Streptomyces acidipaludis]